MRESILAPRRAPPSSARSGCSARSLSVVSRCTPAFQSKPAARPRRRAEEALPVEGAALALGAKRRALARPRASRLQAHDAGQGVGPVEAARRAAHDLDALELEGQGGAEVEGAARLVDRHPVHEHARVARLAPADEHGGLEARLAGARGGDARHFLEERQERRARRGRRCARGRARRRRRRARRASPRRGWRSPPRARRRAPGRGRGRAGRSPAPTVAVRGSRSSRPGASTDAA